MRVRVRTVLTGVLGAALLLAGCGDVAGTPQATGPAQGAVRELPYGLDLDPALVADLTQLAELRTWDPCALVPAPALEALGAVSRSELGDTADTCLQTHRAAPGELAAAPGLATPAWTTAVSVGEPGLGTAPGVEDVAGLRVRFTARDDAGPTCSAAVELTPGGRTAVLDAHWPSQPAAPRPACDAARDLVVATAPVLADPPRRGTDGPDAGWLLTDPCRGAGPLAATGAELASRQAFQLPTRCSFRWADGAATVQVAFGPDPASIQAAVDEPVVDSTVVGRPSRQVDLGGLCVVSVPVAEPVPSAGAAQGRQPDVAHLEVLSPTCDRAYQAAEATLDRPTQAGGTGPTSTGPPPPAPRTPPYGLPLDSQLRALLDAFATWRGWDPCGFVDPAAAASLGPVELTEPSDAAGCRIGYASPPGEFFVPKWSGSVRVGSEPNSLPGTVEQLDGRTVTYRASTDFGASCTASIDLGLGGYSVDVGAQWNFGDVPPQPACDAVRPLVAAASGRLAGPPLRSAAAPGSPAADPALTTDPCRGAGVFSQARDGVPELSTLALDPFSCYVQVGPQDFVSTVVRYSLDPTSELASRPDRDETVTPVQVAGQPGLVRSRGGEYPECTVVVRTGGQYRDATEEVYTPQLSVRAGDCDTAREYAEDTLG